jgi:hypothetical protein
VRYQGGKHGSRKSKRTKDGEEDNLKAQKNPGERIGMHTGDDPADGSQHHAQQGTKQDLDHH